MFGSLALEQAAAALGPHDRGGCQQTQREEAQALILRLLNRQIGSVSLRLQGRIKALSLAQLEKLGEALLKFSNKNDLVVWLEKMLPLS